MTPRGIEIGPSVHIEIVEFSLSPDSYKALACPRERLFGRVSTALSGERLLDRLHRQTEIDDFGDAPDDRQKRQTRNVVRFSGHGAFTPLVWACCTAWRNRHEQLQSLGDGQSGIIANSA